MLSQAVSENEKLPRRIRLARRLLSFFGWSVIANAPVSNKYVVICAPHTSLWDYPLFISAALSLKSDCRWLCHAKLFRGPCGPIVRHFGGYELENDPKASFVQKLSAEFSRKESLVFCLTPEGSSSFVPRWRTGFYYVALNANIPIALGFIDYKNKTLGVGEHFIPSGNIEEDLLFIQNFYRQVSPKNPDRAGLIKL